MKGGTKRAVRELREAFDTSFQSPVSDEREATEDLLVIRAGERFFALRTRHIAAIMRCPPILALPSRHPALAGVVSVRSTLSAVYDVAALLGGERSASREGWIVLCAADRSAALLFDEQSGYERVDMKDIHASRSGEQVMRIRGESRTILDIPKLLEAIGRVATDGVVT